MIAEATPRQTNNTSLRARPSRVTKPKRETISKDRLRELVRGKLNKRKPDRREPGSQRQSQVNASKCLTVKQIRETVDFGKLDCPICLELAVSPIMLTCGHVCCLKCFQESSLFSHRCPLCRQDQGFEAPHRSVIAQTIIQEIILPKSEQYLEYLCREGEFINWEKQRFVPENQIKRTRFVDFKDDDGKWRQGCVKEVVYTDKKEPMVMMRYKNNGELLTAEIPLKSRRFAKEGFFTESKYLKQRTNPTQAESLLRRQIAPIHANFAEEQLVEIEEEEDISHPLVTGEDLDLPMQLLAHSMQDADSMLPFI